MSLNSFNMITQIYEVKASTKHISSDFKRNLLIETVIQIKVGITIYIICTIKIMYAKRIMIRILVHEFVSLENIVKLIYIYIHTYIYIYIYIYILKILHLCKKYY